MHWKNVYYACCSEPYPIVEIQFELHRATMTYVGGMVIPMIVVTIVGLSTLLFPSPTSGAKPALCVTVLLTIATVYFVASRCIASTSYLLLVKG